MPPLNEAALREALMSTIFAIPEIPGRFQLLRINGVIGYVSCYRQSNTNNVRFAPGKVHDVDALIQQVIGRFSASQSSFSWLVGPDDQPEHQYQAERLEAAGLVKKYDLAGMMLDDLFGLADRQTDVAVQEMSGAAISEQIDLLRQAYETSQEAAELLLVKLSPDRQDERFRAYVAMNDGRPVGFGYTYYVPGLPLVNLRMAGTLPDFRRKGVYRSMIAKRLADARDDGMRSAIVTSIRGTSTSSLAAFGFREFCNLTAYKWEMP